MSRKLEQARYRLQLQQSSYVLQRPEELFRQQRQLCDELHMRLASVIRDTVRTRRQRIDQAARALGLLSPQVQIHRALERLRALQQGLNQSMRTLLHRKRSVLAPLLAQLDALSPLAILSRGYALAWKLPERTLIRRADELTPEDEIDVRFGQGHARARIVAIQKERD